MSPRTIGSLLGGRQQSRVSSESGPLQAAGFVRSVRSLFTFALQQTSSSNSISSSSLSQSVTTTRRNDATVSDTSSSLSSSSSSVQTNPRIPVTKRNSPAELAVTNMVHQSPASLANKLYNHANTSSSYPDASDGARLITAKTQTKLTSSKSSLVSGTAASGLTSVGLSSKTTRTTSSSHQDHNPNQYHHLNNYDDDLNQYNTNSITNNYNPEIGLRTGALLGSMLLVIIVYLLWRNRCRCLFRGANASDSDDYDMEYWLAHVDKQKLAQKTRQQNLYAAPPQLPDAVTDRRQATAAWVSFVDRLV